MNYSLKLLCCIIYARFSFVSESNSFDLHGQQEEEEEETLVRLVTIMAIQAPGTIWERAATVRRAHACRHLTRQARLGARVGQGREIRFGNIKMQK